VSCYATAENVLEKTPGELRQLAEHRLTRLYIGPESGDDVTLKRIVKGGTFEDHAEAARRAKATGMELSVIPGTPLQRMQDKGRFELPEIPQLLTELRTIVANTRPTETVFRTNHASSYLSLRGTLPQDSEALVAVIDRALAGELPLRPEFMRAL